jgi:Flp pilus assembly protein TadD
VAGEFWDLIDQARVRGASCAECAGELEHILGNLSSADIEAFGRAQEDLMRTSYRWDLWGAAFVIRGGCSDDGFADFRGWLMLQGRDVWEAALQDSESLADVSIDGDVDCEDVLYVASKVYEQVAGHVLTPPPDGPPKQPIGTAWQETDLEALYPKLWKRFAASNAPSAPRDDEFGDTWDRQMATGMALIASGDFEKAAETFALVRTNAPDKRSRITATNNLAWTDLMIGTPSAVSEALGLAKEALQAIEVKPQNASYIGYVKGTLAFALIKNHDEGAGLHLIQEVLASQKAGPRVLALRLCVEAIGLARTGDLDGARSVIREARKADPQCQLLTDAIREVVGPTIVVPHELQGLAPLVLKFGVSDDDERERVLVSASNEELIALVNTVTKDVFEQINRFLDQTFDSEDAVPFGDLAQAAIEAKQELQRRGVSEGEGVVET